MLSQGPTHSKGIGGPGINWVVRYRTTAGPQRSYFGYQADASREAKDVCEGGFALGPVACVPVRTMR